MQIKINFNKLFELDQSNSQTASTTSLQNSYQLEEPSIISSPSLNINLDYKFSQGLFFQSDQNDNTNILNELSSIGRSFQGSIQKMAQKKSLDKYANKNINKKQTLKQEFGNQNIQEYKGRYKINQNHSQQIPGQRLYYESLINKQRRQKQLKKIKQQLIEQNDKEASFKPVVNQRSKKILQLADSPLRKIKNFQKNNKKKQEQNQLKSYVQRKQQQQLKNCTFHPNINENKNISKFNQARNETKITNNQKVFQALYNQHKKKMIRKKVQQQQQKLAKKGNKMSQQQLQQFLQRTNAYLQQKQHRQQLMRVVSQQYDLTSGRKLFEPKIKKNQFNSTISFIKNPSLKAINLTQQQFNNKSTKQINQKSQTKSQSPKTKKMINGQTINQKKQINKNMNNKKLDKSNREIKQNQKVEKVLSNKKINNKNSSKKINLFPYQVSHLESLEQTNQVNHQNQNFENKKDSKVIETNQSLLKQEQSQNIYLPKSSQQLFAKLKQNEQTYNESSMKYSNISKKSSQKLKAQEQIYLQQISDQDQEQAQIINDQIGQIQLQKPQQNIFSQQNNIKKLQNNQPSNVLQKDTINIIANGQHKDLIYNQQNSLQAQDQGKQFQIEKPILYNNPLQRAKYNNLFQIDNQTLQNKNQFHGQIPSKQAQIKQKQEQLKTISNTKNMLYESIYVDDDSDNKQQFAVKAKQMISQNKVNKWKTVYDSLQQKPQQNALANTLQQFKQKQKTEKVNQQSTSSSPQLKKQSINIASLLRAKKKKSLVDIHQQQTISQIKTSIK